MEGEKLDPNKVSLRPAQKKKRKKEKLDPTDIENRMMHTRHSEGLVRRG